MSENEVRIIVTTDASGAITGMRVAGQVQGLLHKKDARASA